jgi:hypothetical protein
VDEQKTGSVKPLVSVSLQETVRDVAESVQALYNEAGGKGPHRWWSDMEERVRSVGAAVENRATEIAGFTVEDAALRSNMLSRKVEEHIDPLMVEINNVSKEIRGLQYLPAGRRDPWTDEELKVIDNEANRLNQKRGGLYDKLLSALNPIVNDCGIGELTDEEAESKLEETVKDKVMRIKTGADPKTLADMSLLADARLQALSEVREMGGVSIETNDNSSKRVVKVIDEVSHYYPADWIRASNKKGNLKLKDTTSRAHYSHASAQKMRVRATNHERQYQGCEPPVGDNWVRGVWNGRGYENPIDNPDASVMFAEHAGKDTETSQPVKWFSPAFNTRKARHYFLGESVEGPPPRGWEEAFEKLNDGQEIRIFRQARWRMTHGETVSELTVDKDKPVTQWQAAKGFDTAIHEFAHRTEHINPAIFHLEEAFLQRRTTSEDGVRDKLTPLYGNSLREVGRTDSFTSKYMGKEYKDNYREVMSTGMQGLFSGAYGNLAGTNGQTSDPDMRSFILGVLATA